MHSTLRLRPHSGRVRVINSRIKVFLPWVVASAATHGLLLFALLGWESPDSATNPADEVVIELVSIDVAAKQQAEQPVSAAIPAQAKTAPRHNITKTTTVRQLVKKTAPLLAQTKARIQHIPEQPGAQPLQLAYNRQTQPKQQAQPARFNQPTANQRVHASKKTDTNQSRLLIRNHLESFKYYPASARRRGIEGHVEVGFRLTHDGAADQVAVLHGSGYAVLDHAALETVYRAQPFPVEHGQYRFSLRFKRL